MYLTSEIKKEIFTKHGKSEFDTGTTEAQVALLTFRIEHLTGHLQTFKKDLNTQHSLVLLVGKRRKLLDYLKKKEVTRYREIIKKLGIRK